MSRPSPAIQEVVTRLQRLTSQEKRILGLPFALDGTKYHTPDEVATALGTVPGEVRRIEAAALTKLNGSPA